MTSECQNCTIEFSKKDYRQKFCSQSCSAKYHNVRRLKKLYMPSSRHCVICNNNLKNYQRKFCSNTCEGINKKQTTENKIKNGEHVGVFNLRKYLFSILPNECQICKGKEWYGNPMPLVMDHINGNPTDNSLSNLRLICPNCDRFTSTFGSKNRGNGRQSRGMKRYDKYDKASIAQSD